LIALRIWHRTTYAYRRPVTLGPHRLMLRPRENRELRLISSKITAMPGGDLTWAHDVFGNAVATAAFSAMTDVLTIEAASEIELHALAWPVFDISASAIVYPFRYSDDEWTDLGATTVQQHADQDGRLKRWARDFVAGDRTDTLSLLKDLSAGVPTGSATRAGMRRAHSRRRRPWRGAGAHAETSPCCSRRRRAVWASARGSYLDISSIRAGNLPGRQARDRRMPGRRSTCPAPAGSASIRRTGGSADSISSRSESLATSVRSCRSSAALSAPATHFKRCQSRSRSPRLRAQIAPRLAREGRPSAQDRPSIQGAGRATNMAR